MESVIPANNDNYFRRQRAVRACAICHDRKVRCDAFTLGMPCTNCKAFGFDCKIPEPKRKKGTGRVDPPGEEEESSPLQSPAPYIKEEQDVVQHQPINLRGRANVSWLEDAARAKREEQTLVNLLDKDLQNMRIRDAQIRYIGDSSAMSLILNKVKADPANGSEANFYHFGSTKNRNVGDIDLLDLEVLKKKGAFDLPSKEVCDELIDTYFAFVQPVFPIIDKEEFLHRYHDSADPPSLLLMQAMFLAATHFAPIGELRDPKTDDVHKAADKFYKRGKALFESKYEVSRLVLVQSALLLSCHWEGRDNMDNTWYWIGVAIRVAQEVGMHRSVKASHMSESSKKMWRRIWWTLFCADRMVATSLGRPLAINVDDCDIELPTEADFEGDERLTQVLLLQMVKLAEIMGLVLIKHYTAASKKRKPQSLSVRDSPDVASLDMALASWMVNLPPVLQTSYTTVADPSTPESLGKSPEYVPGGIVSFMTATLHMSYYTTLILLHRDYVSIPVTDAEGRATGFPSRNICHTAANMIARILEQFLQAGTTKYVWSYGVHATFSALMIHIGDMTNPDAKVAETASQKVHICMQGLKELRKSWWIAGSLYKLFEALQGDPRMEQKLKHIVKMSNQQLGKRKTSDDDKQPSSKSSSGPRSKARTKADTSRKAQKDMQQLANSVHYHFASRPVTPGDTTANTMGGLPMTNAFAPAPIIQAIGTPGIGPLNDNFNAMAAAAAGTVSPSAIDLVSPLTSPDPTQANFFPAGNRPFPQDLYNHLHTRGENDEPTPSSMLEHFQANYLFPAEASHLILEDPSPNDLSFWNGTIPPSAPTLSVATGASSPGSVGSSSVHSPGNMSQSMEGIDAMSTGGSTATSTSHVMGPSMGGTGGDLPSSLNIGDWYSYFFAGEGGERGDDFSPNA